MGFFTGLNNQARLNGAYLNAMGKFELGNELGLSRLDGKRFGKEVVQNGGINQVLLDEGKGYVQQQLEKEYGLNTNNAQKVYEAIGKFGEWRAAPAGGVPRQYFTDDAKRDINNVFNDNKNNKDFQTGGMAPLGKEVANQKDNAARGFINDKPYLPSFNEGQGITGYAQNVFGLQGSNAKGFAADLRQGKTAAKDFVEAYSPPSTEEIVNRKKQANALARAEIDAVKRYMNVNTDDEAIGIANTNRQQNENYANVLLENSNYVRERLNQGDEELAGRFGAANSALNAGRANVSDLNTAGLGIMRGGFDYIENPGQPARMAGERVQDLIGAGSFADVYRDTENSSLVRKEQPSVVDFQGTIMGNRAKEEADFMVDAMQLGVGPKIDYLERSPNGDTVIGMQNIGENYRSLNQAKEELSPEQLAKVPIQVNQQLGALGLKGIALGDRHGENIQLNKTTNRPIQLDFGPEQERLQGASRVSGQDQAFTIGDRAAKAMIAAGLADEGKLLNSSVVSLLQEGRTADAMDVAKQGLALAQKIKSPVSQPKNVLSAPSVYDLDNNGTLSPRNATVEDLYDTKRLVSPAY